MTADRVYRHLGRAWEYARPVVNATLVLSIMLVALSIWLVAATRSFVGETLNDVKFGLLEQIDKDADVLVTGIRREVAEFETLRADIARIAEHPAALVDQKTVQDIDAVRRDADRIAQALDRIASGHVSLSQQALEKMAVSLVRAYGEIRGCHSASEEGGTDSVASGRAGSRRPETRKSAGI